MRGCSREKRTACTRCRRCQDMGHTMMRTIRAGCGERISTGIHSFIPVGLQQLDTSNELSSWLGLSQPVKLDVVGYYSYADIVEDVVNDTASKDVGVEVDVPRSGLQICADHAAGDGPDGFASILWTDGIGISAGVAGIACGNPRVGGPAVRSARRCRESRRRICKLESASRWNCRKADTPSRSMVTIRRSSYSVPKSACRR